MCEGPGAVVERLAWRSERATLILMRAYDNHSIIDQVQTSTHHARHYAYMTLRPKATVLDS